MKRIKQHETFFNYKGGAFFAEKVPLHKIGKAVGTPTFVYSTQGFLKPLAALKRGLSSLPHLICFAAKSNSNLSILKMLSQAGAGVDIVSGGELFRALKAGIAPEKIVFSGVGKTDVEMLAALTASPAGVLSFNVESAHELSRLNDLGKQVGKKVSVSLRYNPDVDAKTHPYISTGLKKNKFGLEKTEILALTRAYRQYPWLHFRGLSVHIGSQLLSLKPIADAFGRLYELASVVNGILPEPLSILDLGGGLGIRYQNEKAPELEKYCKLIVGTFGHSSGLSGKPLIVLEPGRVLSGNSGVLLTRVLGRKKRGGREFLIVDAGMNDLIRPALYGSSHAIWPVKGQGTTAQTKFDVVGPVCETADTFAVGKSLPTSLCEDDLLAIGSAGAYGFSMSSQYNSRPRAAEVLVDEAEFRVIRRRENFEDLILAETT
ncbi:diaminopimelate decarboxylase [Bdellovibrionota bacterium FG-2]